MPPSSEDWIDEPTFAGGSASVVSALPPAQPDHPAAVLWVPDPEQRHGWREFYVAKAPTPKPGRAVGFR